MRWFDGKPIEVGALFVKRVPSSTADFAAHNTHYWYGYLCPESLPSQWLSRFGKLIEIHSMAELEAERHLYRSQMKPEASPRLAYYEVVNANT